MALKLASVVLLMGMMMMMMMMMDAPIAQATITCSQVSSSLSSCINYLKGAGGEVPPACCSGVKSLNAVAATTPDRQAACNCLKSAATSVPGINPSLASGLPGKCGVSIPYQISPSTDCSQVK